MIELTISLEGSDVLYYLDGFRIGVPARVLVVQAVDVCEKEEEVGVDHGGCDGRQCVIVAKLDFGHGERVVLVDNGDDSHVEELVERVLRIEIPRSLLMGGGVSCQASNEETRGCHLRL